MTILTADLGIMAAVLKRAETKVFAIFGALPGLINILIITKMIGECKNAEMA